MGGGEELFLMRGCSERLGERHWPFRQDRYGEVKINYTGIWVSNVPRALETAPRLDASCAKGSVSSVFR